MSNSDLRLKIFNEIFDTLNNIDTPTIRHAEQLASKLADFITEAATEHFAVSVPQAIAENMALRAIAGRVYEAWCMPSGGVDGPGDLALRSAVKDLRNLCAQPSPSRHLMARMAELRRKTMAQLQREIDDMERIVSKEE